MALTDEARAAYDAVQAAADAAAEDARRALRQGATDAVKAMLLRPDGTRMTLAEAGLTPRDSNPELTRVVYSDGTVNLAAVRRDTGWAVHLVRQVDGEWQRASDRLRSLADLGAAQRQGLGQ